MLQEEIEAFLSMKSKTTAIIYRAGLREFLKYYRGKHGVDKTIMDFIDDCWINIKKPREEQTRLEETELNGFINFMKEGERSNNTIRVYVAALQNLLKYNRLPVSLSFVNLPPPRPLPKNDKHEWKLDHMKEFFNKATNYRDKAIILCLFQSGMGIMELVNLKYGDIRKEFEADILPLCISLTREKTDITYKTFFGRDAVHYLRLYLKTRGDLKDDYPLFTKLGTEKRVTKELVEARFRKIAEQCSFIEPKDLKGYNSARPHSLRSAFRSRLTGKMDPDLIEFFMGYQIGGVKRAYLNLPTDELRELYANYEKLLSIEKTSREEYSQISEEGKLTQEYKEKIDRLERALLSREEETGGMKVENLELQSRLSRVELEITQLKKKLEKLIS